MALLFVDCEAWGRSPVYGKLTEFGVVDYTTRRTFHGDICATKPDPINPAVPTKPCIVWEDYTLKTRQVFTSFVSWVHALPPSGRNVMVSDNPAFDFMWMAAGFDIAQIDNILGHSARRIGDFFAGLTGNFRNSSEWKKYRVTKHTHFPVDDAIGNLESFEIMSYISKLARDTNTSYQTAEDVTLYNWQSYGKLLDHLHSS